MSADTSVGSGRWLAIAASGAVVATVVAAVAVMGSPSAQRESKLDTRRVDDLNHIVQVVDQYLRTHDALPPDLATVASQPGQRLSITDPVDGSPYEYEITGERTYRLCAVFLTDTAEMPASSGRRGPDRWNRDEWNHDVGRQCFDRTARPVPSATKTDDREIRRRPA